MRGQEWQKAILVSVCVTAAALAGCGGNKVLKAPVPRAGVESIAAASDDALDVYLEWVVVRDGPGTWSRNADWDEYSLRIHNRSGRRIRIASAVLFDSMETPLATTGRRKELIKASKETSRRYRDDGVRVKAGVGSVGLLAAGTAAYYAGMGLGYAALTGSVAATDTVAAAAVGGFVLAPVLVAGGIVRGVNNNKVAREIARRQTPMPADIDAGATAEVTFFFPLAPSPRRLEIRYEDTDAERRLSIDTSRLLDGLHIDNAPEAPDREEAGR